MLKNMLRKLIHVFFDKPLMPPSALEKGFLFELQEAFRELPIFETTNVSRAETAWLSNMNRLRELVLSQNPREFLRWDVISQTMFVDNARYLSTELSYLKHRPDWNTRWRPAIRESPVGRPAPYVYYPSSSGNLIHHAYHLAKFEEETGVKVQDIAFVFEFGGGYGSMCRVFHNLGFSGKYIIFDLPHFSLLQKYFLQTIGLPVQPPDCEFPNEINGVICLSDIETLVSSLDNVDYAGSMFLGTWSISEAPLGVREKIMPLLSEFESFLIAYQNRFEEINNITFFDNWKKKIRNVVWHSCPITHAPGNNYLMGTASRGGGANC